MPSPKPSSDKRLWLLGLGLGNFAGLLLLLSGNPVSRRFLETAFPYTASGYYTGDFVLLLGVCLGGLVFPALLTCLARRWYALWGLLPIVLLIGWVVAGKIVNHTLFNLFNPLWPLPLVIFLCWAVACGPTSLFHLLRHKYRPKPAPAISGSPARRCWLLPVLMLPLLALAGLGRYNWTHPPEPSLKNKNLWPPEGVVRLPLLKQRGGVSVKVSLGNHESICRVDTGATDVTWPRNLHLMGSLTGWKGQSSDILGKCVESQTIVLSPVKLGGFEMTDLPTEMTDTDTRLFSPPQGLGDEEEVLLGNPLFTQMVLTIDYKHDEIVLHPPRYDFTKEQRKKADRILEMGWQSLYAEKDWRRGFNGTPAILAKVNGVPAWCTLDTGWGGSEINLTQDFVDAHLSVKPARRGRTPLYASHSAATVRHIAGLHVTFPCVSAAPIELTLNSTVTPNLGDQGHDDQGVTNSAVIGIALMERYRITLDYQRGRVLLEPYARTALAQKQEKVEAGAKQ